MTLVWRRMKVGWEGSLLDLDRTFDLIDPPDPNIEIDRML